MRTILVSISLLSISLLAGVTALDTPAGPALVYAGTTDYATFDASGATTQLCTGVPTALVLAAPGSGAAAGAAAYGASPADDPTCAVAILSAGTYSEAAPSFTIPDPTTGGLLFEFQNDHFVSDGHGGWTDTAVFSNGDTAVTSIGADGAYAFLYTHADGSGFSFTGSLGASLV